MKRIFTLIGGLFFVTGMNAQTYHPLASTPFMQDWTNVNLITANNDWSGVPSIIGYRGDDIITAIGVDPQTVLGTGTPVVNVLANQVNPNTLTSGAVAEFDAIPNPVVALQGSGTADAPNIVIYLNTTGATNINVAYLLRDIDGSADNAIQAVALQYRVGNSGDFINLPAGFVADATTGNSDTQTTPISVTLPADANNQPMVEVRILTTNASGSDEWIGIDNIVVTQGALPLNLISFNASLVNGKASLTWTSANELNVKGFSIEKSLNGTNFSEIDFVAASNRTSNAYTGKDENVKTGTNYYRLKMVDVDGSSRYSSVVVLSVRNAIKTSIFPNPAVNNITIAHDRADKGAVIRILSLEGRQVKMVPVQAGAQQTGITVNELVTGNYLLVFESNGVKITSKFSKQ